MRIPFIRRESETAKQERLAAKEAQRTAKEKAWKRFLFKVKLVIAGVFITCASVLGGLIYLAANAPPQSNHVSPPIATSSTISPSQPPSQNSRSWWPFSSKPTSSPKRHVESEAEKEYESKTGNEIVHRKDGTTYIRQSNKSTK